MGTKKEETPRATYISWNELRLDLEPAVNGSIVQIRLPDRSAFSRLSKASRQVLNTYPEVKSEDDYIRKRVALSGGVFFRGETKFPRSILWRCLGDRNTLELRSVDLSRAENSKGAADSPVILQFSFPAAIRNGCVGFADSEHGDSFDAFIFTENKELYTLTIPSTWFTSSANSEDDPDRWCRSSRPSTLSLAQVFKLGSARSRELLFSMTDGRTVRLARAETTEGSTWVESSYSDVRLGSLRGLIPWQGGNKIRYEGLSLDQQTPLSVLSSPNMNHLVSATLAHTLKIWDVESGKAIYEEDVLGVEYEPNETSKLSLDPGQRQVLAIDPNIRPPSLSSVSAGDQYYIFSYSPHHGGQFKVRSVRNEEDAMDVIRVGDMFPEDELRVPDPSDNAVWTVADFKVRAGQQSHKIELWIMLRLNRRYKIYQKTFSSVEGMAHEWSGSWDKTNVADPARLIAAHASENVTPTEPVALSLDYAQGLPWLVSNDAVSAIRASSEVEQLTVNEPVLCGRIGKGIKKSVESTGLGTAEPSNIDCATLIQAATTLRAGLSAPPLDEAVRYELWQESTSSSSQRIQAFYDRAAFRVPSALFEEIDGHLGYIPNENLSSSLFAAVLNSLSTDLPKTGARAHTSLGRKALIKGAQEAVIKHERIITSLLCLLVWIDQEITTDEAVNLYPEQTFEEILRHLRRVQVAHWLAFNTRSRQGRSVTILEEFRTNELTFRPYNPTASTSLTDTIRDVLTWSVGSEGKHDPLEMMAPTIHCHLLFHGDFALATKFLRFLSSNAWATYVRARYYMCVQDYVTAAVYFKKAAYQCSRPSEEFSQLANKSAHMLTALEVALFGHGLANYYTHVMNLFSASHVQAHTQVVAFGSLALQHQNSYDHPDPPTQQRSDLLSQMFRAQLALGDYTGAVAAVSRYTDKALRKVAIKDFIVSVIASGAVREMLELTFPEPIRQDIDNLLSDRVRSEDGREAAASTVKILYAWRVKQGDYRGAAACLVEKLQPRGPGGRQRPRVKGAGAKDRVLNDYLVSINALALLGQSDEVEQADNEGWLFVEPDGKDGPRSLVRLKDLRREYQEEIDRRERWEKGQFALIGAADEDDDGDAIMA